MQGWSKTSESLQTTKQVGQTMRADYSVASEHLFVRMFDPRHASENPKLPDKLKVRWSCFFFFAFFPLQ